MPNKSFTGLSRNLLISSSLILPFMVHAQMPYPEHIQTPAQNFQLPHMPMPNHQMRYDQMPQADYQMMHNQMMSDPEHRKKHEQMMSDPEHQKKHNQMMSDPEHRKKHNAMHSMPGFDGMRQQMPVFPTPQELSRMTPPEPMTEEKIKARFAKRKALMTEAMERDRKAAEKYARDFARYQKHQSDTLAEIMSKAEKRRKQQLQRLDEQQQHALSRFKEYGQAKTATKNTETDTQPKK